MKTGIILSGNLKAAFKSCSSFLHRGNDRVFIFQTILARNSHICISGFLYSENEVTKICYHRIICCKALYAECMLSTMILTLSMPIGKQYHLFISPSLRDVRPLYLSLDAVEIN